LINTSREQ